MTEPNEQTQGDTGETVEHDGSYAAIGCCRVIRRLVKGDVYPSCSVHGSTRWGWIPPGSALGLDQ